MLNSRHLVGVVALSLSSCAMTDEQLRDEAIKLIKKQPSPEWRGPVAADPAALHGDLPPTPRLPSLENHRPE